MKKKNIAIEQGLDWSRDSHAISSENERNRSKG